MLKEIRQLGFPVVELGHAIRFSLWPGIVKAWEEDLIKIQTLHNFCPVPTSIFRPDPNCYEFSDSRAAMRNAAIRASEDTIRHAARFGAKLVVFHLGSMGPAGVTKKLENLYDKGAFLSRAYTEIKVNAVKERKENFQRLWPRVKTCLEPLVNLAGELNIRLGFEIREDFEEFPHEEEFPEVLEAFPPEVVGYWHDFGHSQCKEFLGWHDHAETLRLRAPRLLGCHIHDCSPPDHDHRAVGDGEIDFARLAPLIPKEAIRVLELSPRVGRDDVIKSKEIWSSFAATSA